MLCTALETLRHARFLLSSPENWTQGAYARNANHRSIGAHQTEEIRCMCSAGALRVAHNALQNQNSDAYVKAAGYLVKAIVKLNELEKWPKYPVHIPDFNDTTNHPMVIKMFDLAIEMAAADEKASAESPQASSVTGE
jgi:hypothetical protein